MLTALCILTGRPCREVFPLCSAFTEHALATLPNWMVDGFVILWFQRDALKTIQTISFDSYVQKHMFPQLLINSMPFMGSTHREKYLRVWQGSYKAVISNAHIIFDTVKHTKSSFINSLFTYFHKWVYFIRLKNDNL